MKIVYILLKKYYMYNLNVYLGSLPKLRELQVTGNPLYYSGGDIVKKGSKYLISFLQEKWKNGLNNSEIIQFNNKINTIKKVDKKILQKDTMKNYKIVIPTFYFTTYIGIVSVTYYNIINCVFFIDGYIKIADDGEI